MPAAPSLRRTCRAARCRFSIFHTLSIRLYHLPPLIPLSRVANMRSVHTLASVQAQCGGTSLPCLALGTPGRLICSLCFLHAFTFLSPLAPRSLPASWLLRG